MKREDVERGSGTFHALRARHARAGSATREGDREGTVVCHSRACLAREESRVCASGMR
jgi:hypothetical protein